MKNIINLKRSIKIQSIFYVFFLISACNNNININKTSAKNSDGIDNMSTNTRKDICNSKNCYILYDEFDIQRTFGLQESQIEGFKHIQKYTFNEDELKKIIEKEVENINNQCNEYNYCNIDVKAKIVLNDDVYFIDSKGYMRAGKKYFKINKRILKDIIHGKAAY